MTTTTTATTCRLSPAKAYRTFVGKISPRAFIAPFGESDDPIDAAITEFIQQWDDEDQPIPSWLHDTLYHYIEDSISD